MPGCVQTMVTNVGGLADPLIKRATPMITQTRKDYPSVEKISKYADEAIKYVEEKGPQVVQKLDDTIDSLPEVYTKAQETASQVYTGVQDTVSEIPRIIEENERVKQTISFTQKTFDEAKSKIEPSAHLVLDKFLEEDKNATAWERVKTIPYVLYGLFLTYAKIALEKGKEYAALAWAQMIVYFELAIETASVKLTPLVNSALEVESVKYYKEQLTTTGQHFYSEYSVWVPKKADELKQRAEYAKTWAISKVPEYSTVRVAAVEKGLPVEKIEEAAVTAKGYVVKAVKMIPASVTSRVETLPYVGAAWVKFLGLLGEDFHDAASDKFVTPASTKSKTSPKTSKSSVKKAQ